jgi:tetratricopeptide (TPR) repeat protein
MRCKHFRDRLKYGSRAVLPEPGHDNRDAFARALSSALALGLALSSMGCHSHRGIPLPASSDYAPFMASFYAGLAALQVSDDDHAETYLARAAQLAPGEPAAWANWGVLALRQRDLDAAAQRLNKAHTLAPDNGHIDYLLGILASEQGNSDQTLVELRAAVKSDPQDLWALDRLASETERQGAPDSEAEAEQLMRRLIAASPHNLAALVELARIAAKRGDAPVLRSSVAALAAVSGNWTADAKQQLAALQAAAAGPAPAGAALQAVFLRNVLEPLPAFRRDLLEIKPAQGEDADPLTHLVLMQTPSPLPAPADLAMSFREQPLPAAGGPWSWTGAISMNGPGAPAIAEANGHAVQISTGASFAFPGGSAATAPTPEGVLPIDFNSDWKTDLVLAGAGGLRFMRQDTPSAFTDVTAKTKLPAPILGGSYSGAWALDVEADGDLDIALGGTSGEPLVLRNNGDGTFTAMHPFHGISGLRQMLWFDVNGDDLPDAALLDGAGKLHIFLNERAGSFREVTLPAGFSTVKAIAAGDVSHGNTLDLVAVRADGAIVRLSYAANDWQVATIANVPIPATWLSSEAVRLQAADLDNNGAIDLLLKRENPVKGIATPGALLWLQSQDGSFTRLQKTGIPTQVFHAVDLQDNGRLDLLGLTADGHATEAINNGTKNYHWQTLRPHAAQVLGDQRINSFGVGGNIEIRSGLLLQRQTITGPQLHFGLGTHTETDVARIVWPNGSVRAEFALKANQQLVAEQRLKGSCPFLFAWNGHSMQFVKDTVPWGAAIGLRIDGVGTDRIAATEEWYKIPRTALQSLHGYYDLRVTGELWESYYYDALSLIVVDHPAGTEIFTDERFDVPPVKRAITAVAPPQPIARAVDDHGRDVTETLSALDGNYLDTFGRGQYQGITRDHYVEIDLGNRAPDSGPLWLIARGWIHPSDSTVNVAMSQGGHPLPQGLSLEIPDGHGGWKIARANLGFPAGRNKICLLNLTGLFQSGVPKRLRLRTNLEIYWDQMQWARGLPDTPLRITPLQTANADLRYRGFSTIHQANASSPEIPDYNHLMGTAPIWRDLAGYYTRYGDVRPLLRHTDDRYVMMNAGDELALRFEAPAPPAAGWVRDYVIAGDGWVKDGDYNSTDSQTVLPLPYHARRVYDTPPLPLREEWVYRHHPEDWQTYQTRYVTPDTFDTALNAERLP